MISDVGQVGTAPVAPTARLLQHKQMLLSLLLPHKWSGQVTPEVQDAIQANQATQTDLTDPRAKVVVHNKQPLVSQM